MDINSVAGYAAPALPGANAQGTEPRLRMGKYAEAFTIERSTKLAQAEEGSMFIVTNPTLGTGVALGVAAATAVIQTAPSILIYNNDAVGGKSIILDSLKLIVTGAGTAGTRLDLSVYMDSTTRFTSGGTANTPVNMNMGVTTSSIAKFYDASVAIVSPAATANLRRVGHVVLRTQIPVVMDQYAVEFGGKSGNSTGITNGTAPLAIQLGTGPVVIAPQQSCLLFLHSASQSGAPTYEFEVTWAER